MCVEVYDGAVSRTNIDIDDQLIERAMREFGLNSKRAAVHLALERLVGGGPMNLDEQMAMEGVGWDGDLSASRSTRFEGWAADADR